MPVVSLYLLVFSCVATLFYHGGGIFATLSHNFFVKGASIWETGMRRERANQLAFSPSVCYTGIPMTLFHVEKYKDKRVCVAVSGGVDSVCLLHCFKEQAKKCGITLSALHIEHGIRGEESVRDMEFCKTLCDEWGIPLIVRRVDVPQLAKESGGNIEKTARAVRYGAFHELLEEGEADLVATAHHADDVAETILFRLARGTGVSGMKAIMEYGGIVRPLLHVTRAEIETYAAEHHLPHVEDSTNADETYTRNYIRHTVLPAFEGIHGNAVKHLVEFASLAAEEDSFLQTLAESKIVHCLGEERVPIDLPDVLFARACLFCMRRYASGGGYTRANIEEIEKLKQLQSGRKVAVPLLYDVHGTVKRYAIREGKEIVFYYEFRKEGEPAAETPFVVGKRGMDHLPGTLLEMGLYTEPIPFSVREADEFTSPEGGLNGKKLFVDLDAFPEGCVVRARREGDVFTPYHAPRKTLKKFLTDRKISARLSKKIPVIAKGNEVFVVVGVEIADSVKVTEHTARRGVIE